MAVLGRAEWLFLLAGFAVLHLAWQTCIVGVVVGLTARLSDRASALFRYRVALTLFLALPVLAAGTAMMLGSSRAMIPATASSTEAVVSSTPWLAMMAPWIGLGWLVWLAVAVTRLVGGAAWNERRARSEGTPGAELSARTRRLTRRLGMRRAPRVRWSGGVTVPSVVGLVAPTVLVPRSLAETFADNEMEALLAHELCHVRRWDLVTNIAQRIVTASLFFHPVARWISRAIDRERELCCDDMVVDVGIPRDTYARALARAALVGQDVMAGTLAATNGQIVPRVRRLLHTPARRRSRSPLAAALVTASTLLGALAVTQSLLPVTTMQARKAPAWQARVLADNPFDYTVNAVDPAGEFTLSVAGGRVVRATVGGRRLAPSQIRQRGALVTLANDGPKPSFSVTLLPAGGIEWPARPPRAPSPEPNT